MPEEAKSFVGLSRMVLNSIESCDLDVRTNLVNNLVLTGGSTLFQNFAERLNNDLNQLMPGVSSLPFNLTVFVITLS
jgi:actin-related protein